MASVTEALIDQIYVDRAGKWFVIFDDGGKFGPYDNALALTKAHRKAIHAHYHPDNSERRASLTKAEAI